jgi:hypothetical protein
MNNHPTDEDDDHDHLKEVFRRRLQSEDEIMRYPLTAEAISDDATAVEIRATNIAARKAYEDAHRSANDHAY